MQREDCLRETRSGVTTPPRTSPVFVSANRWWIYQRERFPLFAHGLLILAFSFSAVAFSHLLRQQQGTPSLPALMVAFVTSLLFFLQLRIADEFKDFDDDARHRPYRPVPRGLVTLGELGVVFLGGAVFLALLGHFFTNDLITTKDAFAGFANSGVITVGLLFIVAAGLRAVPPRPRRRPRST